MFTVDVKQQSNNNKAALCFDSSWLLCRLFVALLVILSVILRLAWPQGYKPFFMLNSIEHEIFPTHKC